MTKSQDLWEKSARYEHVVESLKLGKEKQDWVQKTLNELGQDLKERTESDQWLHNELDQYEERMEIHEQHKQQQTKMYESLKRTLDEVRQRLHRKHIEAGKYEEQKANHEQQTERRKIMVKETARQHSIRGYETDLDDHQIREYIEKISKLYKEQSAAVERIRRDAEREMRKSQDTLSKLGERKSAFSEAKSSVKQQSMSNDRKIGSFQSELNDIEIDEGGIAVIEGNIEDLQMRLSKAKEEFKIASWDTKLQESNSKLRSLEDETEHLNRELIQGTKQAGDLAKLEHLKSGLKNSQRSLDTMIGAHKERLQSIVGPGWQPSTLESDYQSVIEERSQQAKEAERQRDEVSRKLEHVEFQLTAVQAELKKDEKDLEACAETIRSSIQGDPQYYTDELKELQEGRDILKADVDGANYVRKYYTDAIDVAGKHEKCKLCSRRFNASPELQSFIQQMEKKISKFAKDDMNKQLREMEADLERAQNSGPVYDKWVRLSETDLPRLRAEVQKLEEKRGSLLQEVEKLDKTVNTRIDAKRNEESLGKSVASIVRYGHEISSLTAQSQELATKQKDAGLTRTLEDIQEILKSIGGKSRTTRDRIAKITVEKEGARVLVSTLELDLSKARNSLATANHQLEKKANIFKQIEDLRKANLEHRTTSERLEEQIQDLLPKIAEEEARLDDIKQRGSSNEKKIQQEVTKLSDTIHKFKLVDQSIQSYLDGGGSDKLARCRRDIENAQQEIARIENEQKQIAVEINQISEQLRNHEGTKRSIVENINYRRKLQELDSIRAEIAKLSEKNAEADLEQHRKEAQYWQNQHKIHTTTETSKLATMKAKDDQLMQLIKDWNTDYKDAAFKYKESHIKVEVSLHNLSVSPT